MDNQRAAQIAFNQLDEERPDRAIRVIENVMTILKIHLSDLAKAKKEYSMAIVTLQHRKMTLADDVALHNLDTKFRPLLSEKLCSNYDGDISWKNGIPTDTEEDRKVWALRQMFNDCDNIRNPHDRIADLETQCAVHSQAIKDSLLGIKTCFHSLRQMYPQMAVKSSEKLFIQVPINNVDGSLNDVDFKSLLTIESGAFHEQGIVAQSKAAGQQECVNLQDDYEMVS